MTLYKVIFLELCVQGRYLEWLNEETCTEYYIDSTKKCLTYSHHVVCADVKVSTRTVRGNLIVCISDEEHERILGALFQMNRPVKLM